MLQIFFSCAYNTIYTFAKFLLRLQKMYTFTNLTIRMQIFMT